MRWIELNAFTAIFRTHEGNQPSKNIQIDHHERITASSPTFHRYTQSSSTIDRQRNFMHENGVPLVCPIWFYAPDDRKALRSMMLLPLVATFTFTPFCCRTGVVELFIYLKATIGMHFTNGVFAGGTEHQVAAPLGTPAVFIRDDCPQQAAIIECFQQLQHEMLTWSPVSG